MQQDISAKYTADETAALIAAYNFGDGEPVDVLATKFNRTERSIIAKLTSEKVYVSKKVKAERSKTKAELVEEIETILGLDATILASLEKGSREALVALHASIKRLVAVSCGGEVIDAQASALGSSLIFWAWTVPGRLETIHEYRSTQGQLPTTADTKIQRIYQVQKFKLDPSTKLIYNNYNKSGK